MEHPSSPERPSRRRNLIAGGAVLIAARATAQPTSEAVALRVLESYQHLRQYRGDAQELRVRSPLIAGDFLRDDRDRSSADNGGTVLVDALGRRWKRLFQDAANVRWFGAVADGLVDDTDAVQRAIDHGGQRIFFPRGNYRITRTLLIPNIQGHHGAEWIGEGMQGPGDGTELHYTRTDGSPMVTQRTGTSSQMAGFSARFMQFHGPGMGATGGGGCFVLYSATNGVKFDQVLIRQFPGSALQFRANGGRDRTAVQNALFSELMVVSCGGYCFDAAGRVNATFIQPNFNKCTGAFRCVNGEGPGKTQLLVLGLWWEGDVGGDAPCHFESTQYLAATFMNCAWDGPAAGTGTSVFTITGSTPTYLSVINNAQNGFLAWCTDTTKASSSRLSPGGRKGGVISFLAGAPEDLAALGDRRQRLAPGLVAVNGSPASNLGKVVRKVQVFDAQGVSLGFMPVYDAIQ